MKYDPTIHRRRSIRLKDYDYSQMGMYFITNCVHNKELLFGDIENNEMLLNEAGKMVQAECEKLPQRFENIQLREFVVMPNHFHGIIEIVGATLVVAPDEDVVVKRKTIGDMMMAFKSTTTVEYIRGVKQLGWQSFDGKLWQRNYHEHIIRDEQSFQTISGYIIDNPSRWLQDKFYKK